MWKQSEYRRVIAEVVITNVFGCVHFNSKWIVYLSQRYREMTSFLPIQFFLLSNIRCPAVSNTNKIYCSLFFLCSGRIVTGVPFRMKANFIRRKIMKNNFSLEIGLCLVFVALFIRSLSLCICLLFQLKNEPIENERMRCLTNMFSISRWWYLLLFGIQ